MTNNNGEKTDEEITKKWKTLIIVLELFVNDPIKFKTISLMTKEEKLNEIETIKKARAVGNGQFLNLGTELEEILSIFVDDPEGVHKVCALKIYDQERIMKAFERTALENQQNQDVSPLNGL